MARAAAGLAALVVLAALVAGCGGGSSSSGSSSGPLSMAELEDKMESVCEDDSAAVEYNERLEKKQKEVTQAIAEGPTKAAPLLKEMDAVMKESGSVIGPEVASLEKLQPPAAIAAEYHGLLSHMRDLSKQVTISATALEGKEESKLNAAFAKEKSDLEQMQAEVKQAGLGKVCHLEQFGSIEGL
jgi:hypothetical protein